MIRTLRCFVMLTLAAAAASAAIVVENFEDLATSGWTIINRSAPQGSPLETTSWFQGNPDVFPAQSGSPDSYAAASFTSAAFGGNISTWLISPPLVLRPGSTFSFYTRTTSNPAVAPDRLEVRFSSGIGTDVGATDASVGGFTALWLTVNPALSPTGYPADWTQYSATIAGAPAARGRVAFRYSVSDTTVNGDYVGVDTVQYDAIPEPGTWMSALLAIPVLVMARRRSTAQNRRNI